MAKRPIILFPDPRLRTPARAIGVFDDALKVLAHDLLETMRAAPGIGITACHIGILERVVVIELPEQAEPAFYINPEVIWASDELMRYDEGSVSMPGVIEAIERPKQVRLRWQDLAGASHEGDAEGLLAICLQHEIDQLDGIFWLDRLSRLKRERVVRRYEKLRLSA
ncbi:peptide deformylase [Pseudochelatococcus sp. G4_1912]|uniref:peptide deformylase n=1 Tax=Pseudochelatococcus sp. G4_1912 TaxID=3114288 RepID=UPI0039C7431D